MAIAAGEGSVWVFNTLGGLGHPYRRDDGQGDLHLSASRRSRRRQPGLRRARGRRRLGLGPQPDRGHGRPARRRIQPAKGQADRGRSGANRHRHRRGLGLGRQSRRTARSPASTRVQARSSASRLPSGVNPWQWRPGPAPSGSRTGRERSRGSTPSRTALVGEPIPVRRKPPEPGRRGRRGLGRQPVQQHGRADRDLTRGHDAEVSRRAVFVEERARTASARRPPEPARPPKSSPGRAPRSATSARSSSADDETCFHLYEAAAAESVVEATRRAAIPVERVVEAVEIAPTRAMRPARRLPGAPGGDP